MSLGDGMYVDGSWELSILVEDLQVTRRLRVTGETHIGGLMLRLVEAIDVRMDWSDHGLWWPERNRWLLKTRRTLDQCGVQSDAKLEFHRMHGYTRLQLPDQREVDLRLSYSQSVFSVVVAACREMGLRHPEELSLQLVGDTGGGGDSSGNSNNGSSYSLLRPNKGKKKQQQPSPQSPSPQRPALSGNPANPLVPRSSPHAFASLGSLGGSLGDSIDGLADSPRASPLRRPPQWPRQDSQLPRTPVERAVAGGAEAWLDSARSLMEQGLRPGASAGSDQPAQLRLRFKFHAHYDLNPQLDAVRINQLYEQLKWTVITGSQQCTDEEALALAALQLQAELGSPSEPQQQQQQQQFPQQAAQPQQSLSQDAQLDAEIDAAIADLERSLNSTSPAAPGPASQDIMMQQVPELTAWLKVSQQQQQNLLSTLTLRPEVKRRYLVLRETQLLVCADEASLTYPVAALSLIGAEILPESSSGGRMSIRLLPTSAVVGADGGKVGGWWQLRFPPEARRQFAEWSAGLGLASRGRTLASRDLFDAEVRDTLARLELQRPALNSSTSVPGAEDDAAAGAGIDPSNYLPRSMLKRTKPRLLVARILERRANVRERPRIEAKLDYIRAWQRLPMSGVTYFAVGYSENQQQQQQQIASFAEFRRERQTQQHGQRIELFGVAFNRIMRLDSQTGDAVCTWRYHELDSWTVNWEVLSLSVSLRRPPHFISLNPFPSQPALKRALCKTLIEYIGGYVFLSLRKPDRSQDLDEQLFHRLTGCRETDVSAA